MIEIEYKDQNILAPNFRRFLTRLQEEKDSELIRFLLNKSKDAFNDKYRSISCGNLDYGVEIEEEGDEKEKEEIKCVFTPKGKNLLTESNNTYCKKYRMEGNIGSIFKQLIEFDSSLIKCRKKVFKEFPGEIIEDIKFGFNIIDNNFLLLDPNVSYTGKISNYEFKITKFNDSQYEALVNQIKGSLSNSFKFEIVRGKDIVKYYHENSYDSTNRGGNLWGSCMRYSKTSNFIKFYAEIPECSMLILKSKNGIVGRSMLWETNFGIYMDRRYTNIDYLENSFISYAKKRQWMYKTHNNYSQTAEISAYNPLTKEYVNRNIPLVVRISNTDIQNKINEYPYCDTFSHYHFYDNILTNYNRASVKHVFTIKNTGGEKSYSNICLDSLFYNHTSLNSGNEKSNVLKTDLSNMIQDDDIHGYCSEPLVKDWEGRLRLKNLCDLIDGSYVCIYNKHSYDAFVSQKKD